MPEPITLVYAEPTPRPVFLEILRARPEFALRRCGPDTRPEEVATLFAGAYAYQIGSLRDELPRHLWADAALLRLAPDLLAVSSHGAGYDTVDVAAMTEAGVIVMNQKGGNAEGVAEHAVGMMLSRKRERGRSGDTGFPLPRQWERDRVRVGSCADVCSPGAARAAPTPSPDPLPRRRGGEGKCDRRAGR
jgi:hypothetical protein